MEKGFSLEALQTKLQNTKILVIGDCILDRYFIGEVNRISPEAPVPVFELTDIYYSLGGAANVSANLRGLKVEVELIGVLGDDTHADTLISLAKENKIGIKGLVKDKERPTILKTRVIAQSQHLLRIDVEKRFPLSQEIKIKIQEIFENLLKEVKGVIISDYAKGVFLSESFCSWLIQEAKRKGKLVFVDPKSNVWKKYEGATTITPNLKEFKSVLEIEKIANKTFKDACKILVEKYQLEFLIVTLGKEGIYAYHPELGEIKFPAKAKEVYDVSGAGDTVIATFSAFYTSGFSLKESLYLANIAAGIVVGKIGTKPIYLEEIVNFLKEEGGELWEGLSM